LADVRHRTLEFALGVEDYAEFAVYGATHSRFRQRTARWLVLFSVGPVAVTVDLALGIHSRLYEDAGGIPGLIALSLFIGGALVALSWLTLPVTTRLAARRRFRDGTFDAYTKPQTVEISAEGIRSTGGAGDSLTPWTSIVDIAAGRNTIYFYVTSLSAFIVPRRAFADEDAYGEFLRFSREFRASC
jgi:YcxB-like protein